MIRIVALRKAITAGLCGAAVMEVFTFAASKAGNANGGHGRAARLDRIPRSALRWSSCSNCRAPRRRRLLGGVLRDLFWGRFHWRPALQGLVFAIIPATLAIFVVYPELALMRAPVDVLRIDFESFFAPLSPRTVASLLVSHALFGLTIGAIYRRPVGYAVGHKPSVPPMRRAGKSGTKRKENASGFIFATGIECSYPTIEGGRWRRDEMESTRHYEFWQDDLRARARDRNHAHPLWAAAAPDLRSAGTILLGLYRSADGGAAGIRARTDRRSLPLRRSRMARQFAKSRHRQGARGICRRVRRALPVGSILHPRQ